MKVSFTAPRRELRPFIQAIWIFESPTGLPAADGAMATPNGCCKLTFAFGDAFVSIANGKATVRPPDRLNFVGVRDSSIVLQSGPRSIGCIGIEFVPHGAFPVLGIPMRETFNELGDADAVLGGWAREVEGALNDLQDVSQKVAYLQEQLIRLRRKNQDGPLLGKRERPNALVAYCVQTLQAAGGRMPIRELAERTGYSSRYLNTLFEEQVGLSPKVLAGIFRFQRFYRRWAEGRSFDLFRHELYDYYYDQSHFTKEFIKMTGYPPRKFTRQVRNEFGRRLAVG